MPCFIVRKMEVPKEFHISGLFIVETRTKITYFSVFFFSKGQMKNGNLKKCLEYEYECSPYNCIVNNCETRPWEQINQILCHRPHDVRNSDPSELQLMSLCHQWASIPWFLCLLQRIK